jgi:hypothetical protein
MASTPRAAKSAVSSPVPVSLGFIIRIAGKALVLFVVFNLVFAWLTPLPALGKASIYNWLVPGRHRLPFGENSAEAYNLSLFQLDAMFASHEIAVPKADNEYRVILIGDSSVWGVLLQTDETLAAYLNAQQVTAADGRQVRVYNMGYPTLSVTKDLLVLSRVMEYEPDLIVWLFTLEALPNNKQLASPIVQRNAAELRQLIRDYDLNLDPDDPDLHDPDFLEQTIVGQRRALADVIRLNMYGVMWAATGIDQYYPETYELRENDFEPDDSFYDLQPPLAEQDLAFDVLKAGIEIADDVPVLMVNEPIFIASGQNSDIRYNFYYPRWAYDQYRSLMIQMALREGWSYLDAWEAIPSSEFTNSAIHLTPTGSQALAELIAPEIEGR